MKVRALLQVILLIAWTHLLAVPAVADPALRAFENWKTDFDKAVIDLSEVVSGGPPKDGIPSIDDPHFQSAHEITHLDGREPVIVLKIAGDVRAYPIQVMMWHEIVNDTVGGIPVAVTYCPLCNASIVFAALHQGRHLTFGTTGRLRNSDLLMYDRQTESWWQQFTGEAVIGEHAGDHLKMIPSRIVNWGSFLAEHPGGKVLVPRDPDLRDYGRNPYSGYDSRDTPYPLYNGTLPEGIDPMERVVVLRRDSIAVAAIRLSAIRSKGETSLEGFHLSWSEGQASALDSSTIAKGREVGNLLVRDGEPGSGAEAVHDITFAFVVHAFLPDLEILGD